MTGYTKKVGLEQGSSYLNSFHNANHMTVDINFSITHSLDTCFLWTAHCAHIKLNQCHTPLINETSQTLFQKCQRVIKKAQRQPYPHGPSQCQSLGSWQDREARLLALLIRMYSGDR